MSEAIIYRVQTTFLHTHTLLLVCEEIVGVDNPEV